MNNTVFMVLVGMAYRSLSDYISEKIAGRRSLKHYLSKDIQEVKKKCVEVRNFQYPNAYTEQDIERFFSDLKKIAYSIKDKREFDNAVRAIKLIRREIDDGFINGLDIGNIAYVAYFLREVR